MARKLERREKEYKIVKCPPCLHGEHDRCLNALARYRRLCDCNTKHHKNGE